MYKITRYEAISIMIGTGSIQKIEDWLQCNIYSIPQDYYYMCNESFIQLCVDINNEPRKVLEFKREYNNVQRKNLLKWLLGQ